MSFCLWQDHPVLYTYRLWKFYAQDLHQLHYAKYFIYNFVYTWNKFKLMNNNFLWQKNKGLIKIVHWFINWFIDTGVYVSAMNEIGNRLKGSFPGRLSGRFLLQVNVWETGSYLVILPWLWPDLLCQMASIFAWVHFRNRKGSSETNINQGRNPQTKTLTMV